jgi:hypothetical protein
MRQKFLVAALVAGGALLSGCATYGRGGYASVRYGPPAPRYGVIGYAPGPGYIWTDGYWNLSGNRWNWINGRWQRPPRRGATWVTPRWERRGNSWRFRDGRWR